MGASVAVDRLKVIVLWAIRAGCELLSGVSCNQAVCMRDWPAAVRNIFTIISPEIYPPALYFQLSERGGGGGGG